MEPIIKIQNQPVVQDFGEEEKCPICHGLGWKLSQIPEELYGGRLRTVAEHCPACYGKSQSEDLTRVPLQFRKASIEQFNFKIYSVDIRKIEKLAFSMINDFFKWQNAGKGLYLWSKTPGSGKTFLACCIAKSIMVKYNLQMRFTTAPDYLATVGDSYKRERGEHDESEVFRKCKVLILDDIGAQSGKEWQQQEIFRIVNKRLSDGNITIYTSNMPPEQLNLEHRTIDRIIKSSVVIAMPEEGIRLAEAKSEQEQFLKEVVGI